ncbi:MAG: hypothetical protein KAJ03_00690 [Gammaproteobacteria bacterium]|nr:hypothetical protein [Gammaproteobacteria bacterium]
MNNELPEARLPEFLSWLTANDIAWKRGTTPNRPYTVKKGSYWAAVFVLKNDIQVVRLQAALLPYLRRFLKQSGSHEVQ